jgi:hypothetical protein
LIDLIILRRSDMSKVLFSVQGLSLIVLVFLFLCVAQPVSAYTSVVAQPANQQAVLAVPDATTPFEYFGRLDDYPHTFEFEIAQTMPFKAAIFVPDWEVQKNDISIIIIKEERRGVSEVGRTRIKEQSWDTVRDLKFVETFRSGGYLEGTLEPGVYRLEVSSPNNEGKYRVVWGTKKVDRNYFDDVRALFEVKSFLNTSTWSVVLSPLIYIPLFLLIGIAVYIVRKRKKQTQVSV